MKSQKLTIEGDHSLLAATLFRPLDEPTDLVIIMHGFMSSQRYRLIRSLTRELCRHNAAVLTFDFNGHGRSRGAFREMTVENELEDARRVYAEARSWPWVRRIFLVGHSQGGVVTGLLAGELGQEAIPAIVQLAPAAVLHQDALDGHIMNARFDPNNLPEYVRVFFFFKLGRDYIRTAQKIDIYGRSCRYTGPVALIHGTDDTIVPVAYSERYEREYPNAHLHLLEGENHMFSRQPDAVLRLTLHHLLP